MIKTTAPWLSRPTLAGAGLGILAGLLVAAGQTGGFAVRAATFAILASVAYLAGFAIAARRRLADAASYIMRLRAELRASQDHIMDHGSSRSLPAWLAAASATIRDETATLARDARSLAADAALPETARTAAAKIVERADLLGKACAPIARYALTDPSRAPFDLNTLLREALVLCRHRAEERKIFFEERFAVLPPVFGPAGRVQAALLNAIVNAVEAMPFEGGVISIATTHEGDQAVVRLVDTGIGIRPEHMAKVTEPFFTTKPEKTSAGLGLWETRDTIEAIGGTLAIRSIPHQGTEVVLSFPQAAPLSAGRVGVAHPEEVARNTADEGDRRIA
jgi:signal transduction histidine kinase